MARLIERYKKRFLQSNFVSHVVAVSGSALVVQFIGILVTPINSRLYTPSDYGNIALFFSLFSVFSLVGTMRFDGALPLLKSDREAVHTLILSFILALSFSVFVAIVIFVFNKNLYEIKFLHTDIIAWIYFIPLGIFLNSSVQVLTNWAVKNKSFAQLARARIYQIAASSVITIMLGLFNVGFGGLVIGSIAGYLVIIICLLSSSIREIFNNINNFSFVMVKNLIVEHYRFPIFNLPSLLLGTISLQMPIFILSGGFGSSESGYFAMCQRLLLLPTILISGAITPVLYSRSSQALREGNLGALSQRLVLGLTGFNASFAAIVIMYGHIIFSVALGAAWGQAGLYGALLAPWLLINFLVTPLATMPLVLGRQGTDLLFQGLFLITRTASLTLGVWTGDDLVAISLYGLSSAICMLIYLSWLLRLVQIDRNSVFKEIFKEFAVNLCVFAPGLILYKLSSNNFYVLTASILVACAFVATRYFEKMKYQLKLVSSES